MSVSVSLCVCLSVSDHIFGIVRQIFTKIFVPVAYGRGSVLLWRRSDALCTSLFAHKVARRRRPAEAHCTRSLGLGYKLHAVIPVAGQRTHGTTFRGLK